MVDCEPHPALFDFGIFSHEPTGDCEVRGHCVYRKPASGYERLPPVIVLHELYGLSSECVSLGDRLVREDSPRICPCSLVNRSAAASAVGWRTVCRCVSAASSRSSARAGRVGSPRGCDHWPGSSGRHMVGEPWACTVEDVDTVPVSHFLWFCRADLDPRSGLGTED